MHVFIQMEILLTKDIECLAVEFPETQSGSELVMLCRTAIVGTY